MAESSSPRPQKPVTPANTSPAPTKADSQIMGGQTNTPARPSDLNLAEQGHALLPALHRQAFLGPGADAALHLPGGTTGQFFQQIALLAGAVAGIAGEDNRLVRVGQGQMRPFDD